MKFLRTEFKLVLRFVAGRFEHSVIGTKTITITVVKTHQISWLGDVRDLLYSYGNETRDRASYYFSRLSTHYLIFVTKVLYLQVNSIF